MMKEKSMIFITVKLVIAVLLTFIAIELYITGADTESFHKFTLYGRRKEERIEIGKRNSSRFGLSSPEQTVFVNGIKMQQPCAVVDASIHGICIITPCSDQRMKDCDSFNVMLNFVSPEQTIVLRCHKVHAQLKKTKSKIYARISCQLLEPIHFVWKERVIKLLESKRNL